MFGFENITANNGWAMAVVGATIVFIGLVVDVRLAPFFLSQVLGRSSGLGYSAFDELPLRTTRNVLTRFQYRLQIPMCLLPLGRLLEQNPCYGGNLLGAHVRRLWGFLARL